MFNKDAGTDGLSRRLRFRFSSVRDIVQSGESNTCRQQLGLGELDRIDLSQKQIAVNAGRTQTRLGVVGRVRF